MNATTTTVITPAATAVTSTTLPAIVFTCLLEKSTTEVGYKTRKGAEGGMRRLGYVGQETTTEVVVVDGLFRVAAVTVVNPGPAEVPCVDCGNLVDTLRAGEGDPTLDRCPANVGTTHTCHRVGYSDLRAVKDYNAAAQRLAAGDARYAVQA